ncbi:hypothetical protein, partial [Thiolapillus sp.]|uniref:hypothetical protein n=1 Tax=Thiolapillus sp. TaxID=2017437 RepID=UPI003AF8BD3E
MTRTAGAQIGCQRPSRFWGLGCPKIYHEAEDTLALPYFRHPWRSYAACAGHRRCFQQLQHFLLPWMSWAGMKA